MPSASPSFGPSWPSPTAINPGRPKPRPTWPRSSSGGGASETRSWRRATRQHVARWRVVWTAEELRDQLLDQTPIIAGRHISPDSIRRAGWASWRYPLGLRTWQSTADIGNRPIEGATVIWLEAQFTALECLVVPRLARMYPSWTDGQISRAAADALDGMFTAVDASSLPRMGDLGAFREYLAAHPFPDRWLESAGRPLPGRRVAPAPDIDIPRTATIWAALLTLVGGVDDALIDVLLTEWGQGGARRRDQQRAQPAADPFTPPTARVGRDPLAPPSARVSRAPSARDTDTPPPTRGNGGMGMPRLRVGAAVLAVLAALVAIIVLVDQLRDDTAAPETAADPAGRVSDQAQTPPEPSSAGDTPPTDSAAVLSDEEVTPGDPPDGGSTEDQNGRASRPLQRVIGTDSPLAGLPIGGFAVDGALELAAFCNVRCGLGAERTRIHMNTADACIRASQDGAIRTGRGWGWQLWGRGFAEGEGRGEVLDPASVVVSFDDGPPIAFDDPAFDEAVSTLAPGRHTIRINDRQDDEWIGWPPRMNS